MAKAVVLYRIASVLLILFAVGHTFGFLKFQAPTAEGRAVWESMNNAHFQVGRTDATYSRFYVGFGLFQTIGALGWTFFAVQLVSLVLSWIYFLAPPIVLSGLVAICIGWASWLVSTA